ncbi:hypothetical protein AM593_02792, partial [Mytilus galloprovincialis]
MSVQPNMPGRSAMGTSYAPPGGSVIPGAYGPPGGSVVPGAYGPTAQTLGYKSGRAFLPAYSTSPERPAGRVYYQSGGGIPMPPPPPPPPPMPQYGSPGPRVSYLPVSPIASGTPLSRRSAMNEGSLTYPPSPIEINPTSTRLFSII